MIMYCIEYIFKHDVFKLIIVTIPDYTWVEPFSFLGVGGGGGLTLCVSNMLVYRGFQLAQLIKSLIVE